MTRRKELIFSGFSCFSTSSLSTAALVQITFTLRILALANGASRCSLLNGGLNHFPFASSFMLDSLSDLRLAAAQTGDSVTPRVQESGPSNI